MALNVTYLNTYAVNDRQIEDFLDSYCTDLEELPNDSDIIESFDEYVLSACMISEMETDYNEAEYDTICDMVKERVNPELVKRKKEKIKNLKNRINKLVKELDDARDQLKEMEG